MTWPSSSCAFDLHLQSIVMISIVTGSTPLISIVASWSSRQLLLLQLSLTHSDKVKQLHGVCISYNKETTIRLLPVADNLHKTWSSHIIAYITSCLDHITSQHACKNKLDVLYFVVASFTWLLRASSKNHSYLRINHNGVSSSLTRVFRMCKTVLHPLYVNVEPITPDHHVVSQHDEL